ncbi:hypothetical protein LTS10_012335 [Elasticomyces elasticus]|nr:hypothetical protein LTS10_012335 [Elasticomyces elasticus]
MPPQAKGSQSSKVTPTSGTSFTSHTYHPQVDASTQAVKEDLGGPPKDALGLFENWQSSSTKLASGGKIGEQVAQWNIKENRFGQSVEVYQKECFTLKPLTITEGPYKGRNVLMLMPIEPCKQFRFMSLPPELRVMVYKILLLEKQPIKLDTIKVTHIPRRPVRSGFRGTGSKHHKSSRFTGKYIGQTPSNFALLRVSREVYNEAAAVAYSNRLFMADLHIATTFLKRIGNMGRYLKHLDLSGFNAHAKIDSALNLLRDGMHLRAITFGHDSICGTYRNVTVADLFVDQCTPFLKRVHKARKDSVVAVAALDLIQFESRDPCHYCKGDMPQNCSKFCKTTCANFAEHHAEVVGRFSIQVAKVLGIKEGE